MSVLELEVLKSLIVCHRLHGFDDNICDWNLGYLAACNHTSGVSVHDLMTALKVVVGA